MLELKKHLAAVGFEPTPPRRLVPKTSALDRSATLPTVRLTEFIKIYDNIYQQDLFSLILLHTKSIGSGGIRTHASAETGA